jgi:hypothetical protein
LAQAINHDKTALGTSGRHSICSPFLVAQSYPEVYCSLGKPQACGFRLHSTPVHAAEKPRLPLGLLQHRCSRGSRTSEHTSMREDSICLQNMVLCLGTQSHAKPTAPKTSTTHFEHSRPNHVPYTAAATWIDADPAMLASTNPCLHDLTCPVAGQLLAHGDCNWSLGCQH